MDTALLLAYLDNFDFPHGGEKAGVCHTDKTVEREMGRSGEGRADLCKESPHLTFRHSRKMLTM